MDLSLRDSLSYFVPEILLGIAALLVAAVSRVATRKKESVGELAMLAAAASVYCTQRLFGWPSVRIFAGLLVVDSLAAYCKILIGLVSVAAVWISLESRDDPDGDPGELYGVLLCVMLALDLAIGARTFLLGSLTVVAAVAGLTRAAFFRSGRPGAAAGVPMAVVLLAVAGGKVAGFALAVRVLWPGIGAVAEPLAGIDRGNLLVGVITSTTLANLLALRQQSIKWLLVCATLAQAGYTAMGLILGEDRGLQVALLHLAADALMTLGAFFAVAAVAAAAGREDLDGMRGLAQRGGAFIAGSLTVLLLALAGLPPSIGFVAKLHLFVSLAQGDLGWVAAAGVLDAALSLVCFTRVIRSMFADAPQGEQGLTFSGYDRVAIVALGMATLLLGVWWSPVAAMAERASYFLPG